MPEKWPPPLRFPHSLHAIAEDPLHGWLSHPGIGLVFRQDRVKLVVEIRARRDPQLLTRFRNQAVGLATRVVDEVLAPRRDLRGMEERKRVGIRIEVPRKISGLVIAGENPLNGRRTVENRDVGLNADLTQRRLIRLRDGKRLGTAADDRQGEAERLARTIENSVVVRVQPP